MAELKTRLILRNDSSDNWTTVQDTVVLLKGEVGIEFATNGQSKMKIGDGVKAWSELPYFGGAESKTFQVGSLDEITDSNLAVGDTAIVKTVIYEDAENTENNKYSYTGYVYNGTAWAAMDGNYDADNVYFQNDITLAGSYTAVGNVTKSSNAATGTLAAAGKSLSQVM